MKDMTKYKIQHNERDKECIVNYWTKRADKFTALRQEELHSEKYQLWKEELLSKLPPPPCRVLDVGCGAGFFSIILAGLGYEVTGIDLTEEMIIKARKLAEVEGVQCTFTTMDAEQLGFKDQSFDIVISRNVTWNLPHPLEGYREWLRVLKNGGTLVNYDAEYAKYYNVDKAKKLEVHANIAADLMQECDDIQHMLDISLYDRPAWDINVMKSLQQNQLEIFEDVLRKIYPHEDKFYVPEPVFCLKVIKV